MSTRFAALSAALLFATFCVAAAQDGPGPKGKPSIQALLDGIPKDLAANVQANPVRCDRVNDWLQEHVNGKGKTIEVRVDVREILPYRTKEGTYKVDIILIRSKDKFLGDDWRVHLFDAYNDAERGSGRMSFSFTGVATAEAEKLASAKQLAIQGKVKKATLSRWNNPKGFGGVMGGESPATFGIFLEDIQVDGKKWTPFVSNGGFGGGGGPPFIPFDADFPSTKKKGNKGSEKKGNKGSE